MPGMLTSPDPHCQPGARAAVSCPATVGCGLNSSPWPRRAGCFARRRPQAPGDRCRGQAIDQSPRGRYRGTMGRCRDWWPRGVPGSLPPVREPPAGRRGHSSRLDGSSSSLQEQSHCPSPAVSSAGRRVLRALSCRFLSRRSRGEPGAPQGSRLLPGVSHGAGWRRGWCRHWGGWRHGPPRS